MMSLQEDTPCPFYQFVWKNCAPPVFVSLHGSWFRKRFRANLVIKHVVDDAECEVCRADDESPDHLILHCTIATQFWAKLGIRVHQASVSQLWMLDKPPGVPAQHYSTFLLLCAWQIWKHRHEVAFRSQEPSLLRLLLSCKEEARLWSYRLPRQDKEVADACVMCFVPICKP